MDRKELLRVLYEMEKDAQDSQLKEMLDAFWQDADGGFDMVDLMQHAHSLIIRKTSDPWLRNRWHLCAQKYLVGLNGSDAAKHWDDITHIYAEEVNYYLSCNAVGACLQYGNFVLDRERVPEEVYAQTLGQMIDLLLKMKMYTAVKPYVRKLDLFMKTHCLDDMQNYMMLANLMYAYALTGDREQYEYYQAQLAALSTEGILPVLVHACKIYRMSCMAVLDGYDAQFETEFRRMMPEIIKDEHARAEFYQFDQSFLILPILQKGWAIAGDEWIANCIVIMTEHSTMPDEQAAYYSWFFDEMHADTGKHAQLYATYLELLRACRKETLANAVTEANDTVLTHEIVEKYRKQAATDSLTGLDNRFVYENEIAKLQAKPRLPDDLAILIADMNNLKNTNDTLGHWAGDELICRAAQCLQEAYGHLGHVVRGGGDGVVVLVDAERQELARADAALAEAIRQKSEGKISPVLLSVGCVSIAEMPGASVRDLLNAAEARMYDNKRRFYSMPGHERRRT